MAPMRWMTQVQRSPPPPNGGGVLDDDDDDEDGTVTSPRPTWTAQEERLASDEDMQEETSMSGSSGRGKTESP